MEKKLCNIVRMNLENKDLKKLLFMQEITLSNFIQKLAMRWKMKVTIYMDYVNIIIVKKFYDYVFI